MSQLPSQFPRVTFSQLLLALALAFVVGAGCSDVKPKVIAKGLLDLSTDTSTSTDVTTNFAFNYAYRDASAAAPLNTVVYLQGTNNSKPVILSTCNGAGTNCVCQFLDASGNLLSESGSLDMSYDNPSNTLRCAFSGTLTSLAKVKVRNLANSARSEVYPVDTTLTLQKLIGPDQDVNRVRTVLRYSCLYNFLEKAGTTTLLFDCSTQTSLCGTLGGDFCLLQSSFPFHLYTSNYDNNYSQKIADKLYWSEGAGSACGFQLKQYDCAGTAGTAPTPIFGLYSMNSGVFTLPVSLTPGPDQAIAVYGFAAPTLTFMGQTVCPPGLVKRVFYRASTSGVSSIGPSHNYPTTLVATEVSTPGVQPSDFLVKRVGGGDCNGSTCTVPTSPDGTALVVGYSNNPSVDVPFCVIDPTLL